MMWSNTVDLKDPSKSHLFMWRIIGIIPPKTRGYRRSLYIFRSIVLNFVFTIFFPLSILIAMLKCEDFQTFCQLTFVGVPCLGISAKTLSTFFILPKLDLISEVSERLYKRTTSKNEIKCLRKNMNQGLTAFKRMLIFFLISVVMVELASIVLLNMPEPALTIPAWYPFDLQRNQAYFKYINVYQFCATLYLSLQVVSSDTLVSVYCQYFIGHVKALSIRLQKIGTGPKELNNAHNNLNELIECIKDHQHLIRLFNIIQDITSFPIFMQFIITSISQITFGYFAFSTTFRNIEIFSNFCELIAITLETWLPCYYGEKLRTSCDDLANAVYNVKWYEQSPQFRKYLLLFLLRAQKDECLMAGGKIPVTLQTFSESLKIVYSFFTMLRNTM